MSRTERLFCGFVLLMLVVCYGLSAFPSQPTNAQDTGISHQGDSLSRARDSVNALLMAREAEAQASADAQRASVVREVRSRRLADVEKRRADSLSVRARATDSTMSLWRMAYESRSLETEHLYVAIAESHVQHDSLVADTVRLSRVLDSTVTYVQGVEEFNRTLLRVKQCKVGPLPCPSRKQTAAFAIVGTILALVRR